MNLLLKMENRLLHWIAGILIPEPARRITPFDKVEYPREEVIAALCVWEHINEMTLSNGPQKSEAWIDLREGIGSLELRWQSMAIGAWCVKVCDLCTRQHPYIFDTMPFDWEVIPLIMTELIGPDGPAIYESAFPSPALAAANIIAIMQKKENANENL
jgi:hypothetical protein